MVKSLSALAVVSLLGASMIALPGFAQTSEVALLAKGDRLEARAVASNCATEAWPNFTTACLRSVDSGRKILEARLVTARR
jgi:hypothetical protein